MEYIIRVVWEVYIPNKSQNDLEILAEWALDNISNASAQNFNDLNFFPVEDRDVYYWEDGSGFTVNLNKITKSDREEDVASLMPTIRHLMEESGANLDHVAFSYENI